MMNENDILLFLQYISSVQVAGILSVFTAFFVYFWNMVKNRQVSENMYIYKK